MNEIRKKQKISDGIRTSKTIIKKRIPCEFRTFSSSPVDIKKSQRNEVNIPLVHKKNIQRIPASQAEDLFTRPQQKNQKNQKKIKQQISLVNRIKNNKKILKWFFSIIIFFSIIFFLLNRNEYTKITLTPKTQGFSESQKVKVFLEPMYDQLGFDIIAISGTHEKTITASQKKSISKKSTGTITIFNGYSSEPQKLSPNTRFRSVSGKIFKLGSESVTVPGKKGLTPGSIDVTVYADQAGFDYNIDITDFTIPGFKESGLIEKYETMYGLSVKPFTGGMIGEQLVLGDEQKNATTLELEAELKEDLVNKLEAEKTEKVLLVDNSLQIIYKEPIITEEENNTINIKQDAQIFALVIEKKQLELYLSGTYLSEKQSQKVSISDFKDIYFNYDSGKTIDFKSLKNIELSMNFNTTFVWNIDIAKITPYFSGVEISKIPLVVDDIEEVSAIDVHIQPFWRKTISDEHAINIEIKDIKR